MSDGQESAGLARCARLECRSHFPSVADATMAVSTSALNAFAVRRATLSGWARISAK